MTSDVREILVCVERHIEGQQPWTDSVRQYLASACERFLDSGMADPHFLTELASGSEPRFWSRVSEALIYERLRGMTFGSRRVQGAGPDFVVIDGCRKVWIEVVCPAPMNVPSDWRNHEVGGVVDFPHEAILLRWTSSIMAKAEKLIGSEDGSVVGYLNSGVVDADDAYVIAVNGCQLRSGPFPALIGISQFPFAAEAVFPIGPYQLRLNRESLKVVDHGHQMRPYVCNKNGAKVPAYTFLDPRFNAISAIWGVDLNGGSAVGNSEPMVVVHNPNATNPVPLNFLPADDEYTAVTRGEEVLLSRARSRNVDDA